MAAKVRASKVSKGRLQNESKSQPVGGPAPQARTSSVREQSVFSPEIRPQAFNRLWQGLVSGGGIGRDPTSRAEEAPMVEPGSEA